MPLDATRRGDMAVGDMVLGEAAQKRPPRPALFERLLGTAFRRLGWGVADQAVSSFTNFAVSIYVVHALGAARFGAFSLAYVTYSMVLTVSRGLTTEPLMVRFSGTDVPTWRRAVAGCTATSTAMGLAGGVCVAGVAWLLGGTTRSAFMALGLTLPGLMLQDSWRYAFFALGRGRQAFFNDVAWAIALLPSLGFLWVTSNKNVFWFVFAWGGGACFAAVAGLVQARAVPKPTEVWRWVSHHRDLGFRFVGENATRNAASQLQAYGIALILGLASLGIVQAAGTLMGAITTLSQAMSLVAVPEGARILRRSPERLSRFSALVSGGLVVAVFLWGVALLVAVPMGLGQLVLGPIWRPAYPVIVPIALIAMGSAANKGPSAALHALGAAGRSLRAAVFSSSITLVLALAGAATEGVVGAVSGTALAMWIGVLVIWWQLRTAIRESGRVPAGAGFWSGRLPGRHSRQRAADAGWDRKVDAVDSAAEVDDWQQAQEEALHVLLSLSRLSMPGPVYETGQFPVAGPWRPRTPTKNA